MIKTRNLIISRHFIWCFTKPELISSYFLWIWQILGPNLNIDIESIWSLCYFSMLEIFYRKLSIHNAFLQPKLVLNDYCYDYYQVHDQTFRHECRTTTNWMTFIVDSLSKLLHIQNGWKLNKSKMQQCTNLLRKNF